MKGGHLAVNHTYNQMLRPNGELAVVHNERGVKLVLGPPQAPVSVAYRNSAFYVKLAATTESHKKLAFGLAGLAADHWQKVQVTNLEKQLPFKGLFIAMSRGSCVQASAFLRNPLQCQVGAGQLLQRLVWLFIASGCGGWRQFSNYFDHGKCACSVKCLIPSSCQA